MKLMFLSRRAFAVAGIFTLILIGVVIAQSSLPHLKFEAESGTRSGSASVVSDTAASGGQALQFSAVSGGPSGKKCAIWLHGKGGDGGPASQDGDVTWISPTGNGDGGGWGPHHWEYATTTTFNQALTIISNALAPHNCGQVLITGFSNGAAMAAKIYCTGQTFNNRVIGVIVDDPVPDQVVDNCSPASGVALKLVQSNEMNSWIGNGGPCPGGWTCQGNVYSRSAYASRIGATDPYYSPSHFPVNGMYNAWASSWWK